MIFVTHRTATEKAQRAREDRAKAAGISLRIYDRGWLWPRLETKHRRLAEDHLGLKPALPERFMTAEELRARLDQSIPGFDVPAIETAGRLRVREAVVAAQAGGTSRTTVIEGHGGMGKTRAALDETAGMMTLALRAAQVFDRDAVGALPSHEHGIVILDDAHQIDDLSGVRLLLDDRAWARWQVVLTVRRGFAERTLVRAGVLLEEASIISFEGLNRPEATRLLRAQPYGIRAREVLRYLVDIARGNPLVLHLGAKAAVRGDLAARGQAEVLRALSATRAGLSRRGFPGDLIAIAALCGGLSARDDLPLIRQFTRPPLCPTYDRRSRVPLMPASGPSTRTRSR